MASQWSSMRCLCAQCRRSCCSRQNDDEEYAIWVRRNSPVLAYNYEEQENRVRATKSLKELNQIESSGRGHFKKKVRLGITTIYGSTQSLFDADLVQAHEAIWQLKSSVPRLAAASSQPIAANSEGYNFICNCDERRSQSCDPQLLKSTTVRRGILRETVQMQGPVSKTQPKRNERKVQQSNDIQSHSRFSRNSRSRRSLHEFARDFKANMRRGFNKMFTNGSGGNRLDFFKIVYINSLRICV